MRKLLLPIAMLLFTAACTKTDMPAPANVKTDPNTLRPDAAMRRAGDTLIKVTHSPFEKWPITNEKIGD